MSKLFSSPQRRRSRQHRQIDCERCNFFFVCVDNPLLTTNGCYWSSVSPGDFLKVLWVWVLRVQLFQFASPSPVIVHSVLLFIFSCDRWLLSCLEDGMFSEHSFLHCSLSEEDFDLLQIVAIFGEQWRWFQGWNWRNDDFFPLDRKERPNVVVQMSLESVSIHILHLDVVHFMLCICLVDEEDHWVVQQSKQTH